MSVPMTVVMAALKVATAIVKAYQASIILRVAIHVAATLAITAIATALAGSGKGNQGQELQLKLDPNMPRQVLVGQTATGGSQAWAFTYGSIGTKVPNRYLVRIIVLSDRPCTGLVRIMEGNVELSFSGDVTTGERECTSHRKPDGTAAMWVEVHLGSDTPTTPAWLITASGGAWTSSHKGTGLCYATVRYDYDPEAYSNGEPQLSFVLQGAKAYDDRLSVANGGSQVLATPSTWAYSENAAILAAQLLRGYRTNGSLIVGAQAREKDLPEASLIAAYNTCDQDVALAAGGTEKRYRASLLLTASESTQSMLDDLKNAMDGNIYDRGGKITILPGAVRTPVFHLTDDDIDWTASRSYQPVASLGSLYNQVNGTYVPSSLNYIEEPYPIQKDAAYVTADGGQNITLTQDFRSINSDTQVQRVTTRLLKASRFQKIISFTGPLWLYEAEQGDWFTMTSARWGFTSKYFDIKLVTLSEDMRVTIIAVETSPDVDGWSTANEVARTTTTVAPAAYMLADPIITLAAVSVVDTVDGNTITSPAIDIGVTVPEGSPWSTIELQIRLSEDNDSLWNLPSINRGSVGIRVSDKLLSGQAYQVRGRTTDGEEFGDWTDWSDHSVTTFAISITPNIQTTDLLLDEAVGRFGGFISEQARRQNLDRETFDRFEVLGAVDPVSREAVLRGGAIQTHTGGLYLDDAADRTAAGFTVAGVLQTAIPADLADASNLLQTPGGGEFLLTTAELTDDAGLGLTAVWGTVTGTGRPADNATVGARAGVNLYRDDGVAVISEVAILNSGISINPDGSLTGAGGGSVTITGLGYIGDLDATRNVGALADLSVITASELAVGAVDLSSNKVTGKSLANIDSTAATKLSGIQAGAQVNPANLAALDSAAAAKLAGIEAGATDDSAVIALGLTLGDLATSPLTEAKVQGRFFGTHAGDTAANAAGLQDGDVYIDSSLVPNALKAKRSGTITEIDNSGIRDVYQTQVDVASTSWTDVAVLSLDLTQGSKVEVWFSAEIETTPSPTSQSIGAGAIPAGDYQIIEGGGSSDRTFLTGTWGAVPSGSDDTIVTISIDSVPENLRAVSVVSDGRIIGVGGTRTYYLQMRKNSSPATKSLSKVGLNLFVQVQRPTS